MQRRTILKSLCIIPLIGLLPSLTMANEIGNDVVGLDKIIDIIKNDTDLHTRAERLGTESNILDAISCAERMNEILIESIIETGVGNDKSITTRDVRELNDYIFTNYHDEWVDLHGNDENGDETGFHQVVNNGAKTMLYGVNAINKMADSIYHLGFDSHRNNRLINEDNNGNATYSNIANWLDVLLHEDLEAGRLINTDIQEVVGTTGTGLDMGINIIYTDKGLNKRISLGDMREGAKSVDGMNTLLLEAIAATNAAENGTFTAQDMRAVNGYLVQNHLKTWAELHGDDENDEETGFHKVQSDGATTLILGLNAINKVCDGIHHLGFETQSKIRLVNEDGNANATFANVATWLNQILVNELENGTI